MMTHTAVFSFSFRSEDDASVIVGSLFPEVQQVLPKSHVTLENTGSVVHLRITTQDVSALRAACNSYLRWIQTALQVKQLV